MNARIVTSALFATVVLLQTACNRRVFEQVETTCDTTLAGDFDVKADKAADILIVVDNSGSMLEEQLNLANNFINNNPGECPISIDSLADFGRCNDAEPPAICEFANPPPEDLVGTGQLAACGFIQVLAAYENDFRIGVITTDVGSCDNRCPGLQAAGFCAGAGAGSPACSTCDGVDDGPTCTGEPGGLASGDCGQTPGGWGFRPQRGCLQPADIPSPQRVISRADLVDADASNDNIGARFTNTLNSIRTYGTSVERGLDAAQLFLDSNNTDRGPGCANDLDNFRRPDAKLVMIFLSDEQDCSHGSTSFFPASFCPSGQSCSPGFEEFYGDFCGVNLNPLTAPTKQCYERVDELAPVSGYADFFRSVDADVSVAVIAGGANTDNGFVATNCSAGDDGLPSTVCAPSFGSSNSSACIASGDCCQADSGSRYFDLVDELGGIKDSICFNSFRQTMTRIASFIGAVDKVTLAEEPESPQLVVVEKASASDNENYVTVPRIDGTACGEASGWVLETDGVSVRFCGTERPGPGDRVRVRAKGRAGYDDDTPNQDRCIQP